MQQNRITSGNSDTFDETGSLDSGELILWIGSLF
jgi:hypothetical protein